LFASSKEASTADTGLGWTEKTEKSFDFDEGAFALKQILKDIQKSVAELLIHILLSEI